MQMQTLDLSNAALREAVETRLKNAGKPHERWYEKDAESRIVQVGSVSSEVSERHERPGSLAFMEVIEEIRQIHIKKSQDYGEPGDALANIRSGAELVGIEPWRGCLVRIADKVQRIRSYCRDGRLANEGFEDTLLDLASYAVIALIMFRESQAK
jgi:hypothetical protein